MLSQGARVAIFPCHSLLTLCQHSWTPLSAFHKLKQTLQHPTLCGQQRGWGLQASKKKLGELALRTGKTTFGFASDLEVPSELQNAST